MLTHASLLPHPFLYFLRAPETPLLQHMALRLLLLLPPPPLHCLQAACVSL